MHTLQFFVSMRLGDRIQALIKFTDFNNGVAWLAWLINDENELVFLSGSYCFVLFFSCI
jgi:hypothetical protein